MRVSGFRVEVSGGLRVLSSLFARMSGGSSKSFIWGWGGGGGGSRVYGLGFRTWISEVLRNRGLSGGGGSRVYGLGFRTWISEVLRNRGLSVPSWGI